MADSGSTMHHMLTKFSFAPNAVSSPPRMMPVSQAIWYAVPTVAMVSTFKNCNGLDDRLQLPYKKAGMPCIPAFL